MAAPGTLLSDGAKELGQLGPETTSTYIGSINIEAIQQILNLPMEVQDEYLRTGRLPPDSYLPDVPGPGEGKR